VRASGASPGRVPAALLSARLAAVFLLSLSSLYHIALAWEPALLRQPLGVAWPPFVLAAAALAGAALHDRLAFLAERAGRGRIQMAGWIGYNFVLIAAILGAMAGEPGRGSAGFGASVMRFLQPCFLLLAGLGRGYIGAITNAFALTCHASLAGGVPAASAAVSFAAVFTFFLVVDHHARKLTEYPVEIPPRPGGVLARAALQGAGMAAVLAGAFLLWPPQAAVVLARPASHEPLTRGQVLEIYATLAVVALVCGVGFYLLLRLAVGRGRGQGELQVERVAARRRSEPVAPPASPGEGGAGSGWEGRIVKTYVRLLNQLARLGVRRRLDETPREFSARLAPRDAAEAVTGHFSRARYGPGGATEADFREASRAGELVLGHFRGRRQGS